MAVLIDPPAWPAHGRLWSHLASDTSYDELHAFAARAGLPQRAFDGDHYDVGEQRYADLVAAGARPVACRDLLQALQRAGLRRPKRRGERVLASWPQPDGARLDLLASSHEPATEPLAGSRLLVVRSGRVALGGTGLPAHGPGPAGQPVGHLRLRGEGAPRWLTAYRDGPPPPDSRWVSVDELPAGLPVARWLPLARHLAGLSPPTGPAAPR